MHMLVLTSCQVASPLLTHRWPCSRESTLWEFRLAICSRVHRGKRSLRCNCTPGARLQATSTRLRNASVTVALEVSSFEVAVVLEGGRSRHSEPRIRQRLSCIMQLAWPDVHTQLWQRRPTSSSNQRWSSAAPVRSCNCVTSRESCALCACTEVPIDIAPPDGCAELCAAETGLSPRDGVIGGMQPIGCFNPHVHAPHMCTESPTFHRV